MSLFCILLILPLITPSKAILGWDGIQVVDSAGFQCLAENGFQFYIGKIWSETGEPSPDGIENIKAARAAGFPSVDGYIYPCTTDECSSGAEQMEAAINNANQAGAEMGSVWIDVEIADKWWDDQTKNQQFITEMIQKADEMQIGVGIYTKMDMWQGIVGADWTGASGKFLWYADWNGSENFDGFEAFGGWSTPTYHQFEGDVEGPCGVKMDKNFRESL